MNIDHVCNINKNTALLRAITYPIHDCGVGLLKNERVQL